MKITVIGGGSTYTPELINGLLSRQARLPICELWLMDSDRQRLEIVGGFAQRMVSSHGQPFKVVLSTDRRAAIKNAAYVLTQFRIGMMEARRNDEYLGFRHGLIGQETTGVGGMAMALRTIPVMLAIAGQIQEFAPGALLINFTNPAGLVTEAVARYAPQVPVVGLCNVALTTKMKILEKIESNFISSQAHIDPARAQLNTLGLNHLTWHRGFSLDGEDLWPRIFPAYLAELQKQESPEWDVKTLASVGMIPNYYLAYYYYTDQRLKLQEKWPPSRAEQVMEIEHDLLRAYADPGLAEPPADLMKRGGAYYSTMAAQLIESHFNDLGDTQVVNIRQDGAVAGWPADWVLEMPARVSRSGIHPLPAEPLPPVCFGLLSQVKMYELLTVKAAVFGDRDAAYQALLTHPLGPQADKVEDVLNDMLETNKEWLPRFS